MSSGIYSITNVVNGHRYIGSAVNLTARWSQHRNRLRLGSHNGRHLQNAWNKHGENTFVFEVLEEVDPEFLVSMEQWWMNMLRPEYNVAPTAGSSLGVRHTEDSRLHMSEAKVGNQYCNGRIIGADTRRKLSVANTGKHLTEEARRKIGVALKGYKHTPEMRAKSSTAKMGNKHSVGRVLSADTRLRISEAKTGKKRPAFSDEWRHNLSVAATASWERRLAAQQESEK